VVVDAVGQRKHDAVDPGPCARRWRCKYVRRPVASEAEQEAVHGVREEVREQQPVVVHYAAP
jgi:hypothetical protein